MLLSNARRLAVCVALVAGFAHAVSAADILIADAKSQPESLTVAPGGVLIVGSASTPFVYKVRSGSTTAEKFVDASAEGAGTFFFGMLADASSNTLWTCKLTPVPGTTPVRRHTALNGITFLNGTLYVNNVFSNNLYRIPVDAAGKAGQPVDIWMDQPIKGPDGMRAANGKLIVAENGSGRISVITVNGDKASVTVIKEGLNTPTGVERAGDTIWIAERGAGKAVSIPMPK
jgi:sugar lactone lactonase YvrE